jgi:DNA replicative helicase MCM subunit Mcm2 (Cdc46/Mcm family)
MGDDLLQRPGFHLPLFESAALEAAVSMAIVDESSGDLPTFQITLTSSKQPITIRQLLSSQVSRVVMIPGIVISSSKVKAKATTVVAQCKGCRANKQVQVRAGFAGVALPRKCDEPRQPGEAACPLDPYAIVPEKCTYVDMQTWKLQESPEMVRCHVPTCTHVPTCILAHVHTCTRTRTCPHFGSNFGSNAPFGSALCVVRWLCAGANGRDAAVGDALD